MKRKDEEVIESRIKICLKNLVINYPTVNALKLIDLLKKNKHKLDDQSKNLHQALKQSEHTFRDSNHEMVGPRKRLYVHNKSQNSANILSLSLEDNSSVRLSPYEGQQIQSYDMISDMSSDSFKSSECNLVSNSLEKSLSP